MVKAQNYASFYVNKRLSKAQKARRGRERIRSMRFTTRPLNNRLGCTGCLHDQPNQQAHTCVVIDLTKDLDSLPHPEVHGFIVPEVVSKLRELRYCTHWSCLNNYHRIDEDRKRGIYTYDEGKLMYQCAGDEIFTICTKCAEEYATEAAKYISQFGEDPHPEWQLDEVGEFCDFADRKHKMHYRLIDPKVNHIVYVK